MRLTHAKLVLFNLFAIDVLFSIIKLTRGVKSNKINDLAFKLLL
jgi:hypothetical protein